MPENDLWITTDHPAIVFDEHRGEFDRVRGHPGCCRVEQRGDTFGTGHICEA